MTSPSQRLTTSSRPVGPGEPSVADSIEDDIATISRIDAVPKILEVVCRTTGMGFAAVARVTEDRWVACAVRDQIGFGLLPGGELEVKTTICDEIRASRRPVVIDHVLHDRDFHAHHTPARYGFQSYISVPILHDGAFFGTLCAIDPKPAHLKDTQVLGMFELFAELIGAHLEAEERLVRSEAALLDQVEAAELREQFIAVLGHDLRNPLASIDAVGRLLRKTPLDAKALSLVGVMHESVVRMAGLIDNVLDLARGRLGGGFAIERKSHEDMPEILQQVIQELQLTHADQRIEAEIDLPEPVSCDSRRVAQLLSNLLANALNHGSDQSPVKVRAGSHDGIFELSVSNAGEAIPEAARTQLFQPFSRAALRPHQQGLGLGLYICAEIARAHDGVLVVDSDDVETRFTFRMPLAAPVDGSVLASQRA